MTDLLLKIFVKDYRNVSSNKVRSNYGLLGACVGIVTNLILVVGKLVVGMLFFNLSIIADALNNLSDFGNCILTVFGFKLASKPADEDHPYGHERMEYIISLIIAIIIIALGINILISAVQSIMNPAEPTVDFPLATIIVLAISILIKVFQSYVYYSLSKRINSIALRASGADARNDVLATSAVLIGVIISYYTKFTQIDGILAILVSLFIGYSGLMILKDTGDILLGEKPSQEKIEEFLKILNSNPAVLGTHDLEMHCYGPNAIFASVHVEVDGKVDVFASHDMIDNLESECFNKLNIKTVIHMDPVKINDPETDRCKKIVLQCVNEVNPDLTIHDFRIVSGPTHINVVFDMVLPFSLQKEKAQILAELRKKVVAVDPKINLVITIDDQYTLISKENN